MVSTKMRSTQGMTLLEIVISSAILAMITLVLLTATIPVSDASSDQGAALDMDRQAAKFLSGLRREVRQSGYTTSGTAKITRNSATQLTFAMRTGPNDTADWSTNVVYSMIVDPRNPTFKGITGTPARYKITRLQNGVTTDVISDVADLTYTLAANSKSVEVKLVMLRASSRWTTDNSVPPPIRREYTDQIEMMNWRIE